MKYWRENKKELLYLSFGCAIYIGVLIIFTTWKYYTNKYNVLDLAIFNQVFWNLSHGNGFASSIQGGSYLGDHAEFFILLLLPIYSLIPHPLTLLSLQTIGLASTAFPIYFLSNHILKAKWQGNVTKSVSEDEQHGCPALRDCEPENRAARAMLGQATVSFCNISLPLLISLTWFINPIVWNINFFEFHILPFAIPLLLWTIYFYLTNRTKLFFVFLVLSLLVREDVSLITLLLGIVVFTKRKWVGLITIVSSILWFFGATRFIARFSTDDTYKYLSYYSWLGGSFGEIIQNIFLHPISILRHIMTLPNIEMVIGFFMVFLFFPLFQPKFLLLALIPLLQFILGNSGGGALVLQIHYAALFLPGLALAYIYGFAWIYKRKRAYTNMLIIIVVVGAIYNFIALGPINAAITTMTEDLREQTWKKEKNIFDIIPVAASVAATYTPLAQLSSRNNLYALHYLYIGKKQFSTIEYQIAEPPDFMVIDERDFAIFKVLYESLAWTSKTAPDGFTRIRALLEKGNYGVRSKQGALVLLQKNMGGELPRYTFPQISQDLHGYVILNGIRSGDAIFF